MSQKICVAGKGRMAINALKDVMCRVKATDEIYAVFNATEDGVNGWQPSFSKFVRQFDNVGVRSLREVTKIPDLTFLSMEFDKLLRPEEFVGDHCLVNLHFSMLPAYKGMFTSALPILHGASSSGCTLHVIDAGIDTGAIIAQAKFDLAPNETCKTLYSRYVEHGSALFAKWVDRILRRKFVATAQSAAGSTYFSKSALNYSALAIDWNQTAEQVYNQLRAFNHRSYQLPSYGGRSVAGATILATRSGMRPGACVTDDSVSPVVATIDFDLQLAVDEFDSLIAASRAGDIANIKAVVGRNPMLLSESTAEGWTPMMVAAYEGATPSIEMLLNLGADPGLPNQKGTTPLMYAKDAFLRTGDITPSQLLLAAGADYRAKDMHDRTLLDYLDEQQKNAYMRQVLHIRSDQPKITRHALTPPPGVFRPGFVHCE